MALTTNIVYWKNKNGVYLNYYDFNLNKSTNRTPANFFIGKTDYDLYSHDLAQAYHQQDLEVMTQGHPITYEITSPDCLILLEVIKQPLRDENNEIIGIIAHINDHNSLEKQYAADNVAIKKITQDTTGGAAPSHLSNIENVKFLRDYLENIIALMPGHVYWLNKNNVFLGCNNLQAKNANLESRKDIIGKTNYDMPWKEQADELNKANNKVLQTGEAHITEEFALMANGTGIYLSQKVPLRDPFGNIAGIVGISFDITDRKKAEEERLNLILKASNMGTWSWDFTDDTFTHDHIHHETPYRFNGCSAEAIARAHLADQESLRQAMLLAYQNGTPLDIEYRLNWLDGKIRYIAMRGKVIENRAGKLTHMVGVCWDITERKELEKNLYQQHIDLAQIARLNAMGELASTLAHELNQPLASISNYVKGCVIRLKSGNYAVEELLNAMNQAAAQSIRAGEIIHRLKNFIQKGKLYYETVNLNTIIQESIAMVRHEPSATTVNIELDLTQELPILELDKIQIGQVILNLLRNAIEAMQQKSNITHPKIIVKTHYQENKVYVDIIDNGPGCSNEVSKKVFTPYFTTKETGMGMGLAICRTIIEAHSGCLTILPNLKPGAWFRFCLPIEK